MSRRIIATAAAAIVATLAVTTAVASGAAAGKTYRSTVFNPAFTVSLPSGWTVTEADPGAAWMFKSCGNCPHGGEENGTVTLDMALGQLPLTRAAKLLHRETRGAKLSPLRRISIGKLRGMGFTARNNGTGETVLPWSGYHTPGSPLQVWVVRAADTTVTIIQDPGDASGPARFPANAAAILKTLRFPA